MLEIMIHPQIDRDQRLKYFEHSLHVSLGLRRDATAAEKRRVGDAPLDAESSRAAPSHTSRRETARRGRTVGRIGSPPVAKKMGLPRREPFLASYRASSPFYHDAGTRCDGSSGSAFRRLDGGNQSGRKLNITPRRRREAIYARAVLTVFSRSVAKFRYLRHGARRLAVFGSTRLCLEISPRRKEITPSNMEKRTLKLGLWSTVPPPLGLLSFGLSTNTE